MEVTACRAAGLFGCLFCAGKTGDPIARTIINAATTTALIRLCMPFFLSLSFSVITTAFGDRIWLLRKKSS